MTVFGRIAWYALWVVVAVAAVGFELDRESKRNTSLAGLVPAPFQGFALEVQARGDFARGDYAAGLQAAREMVAHRPIPAEGLALIARGELAAGQDQLALAAVLASAERGWRDSFTQAAVVQLAIQGGDWEIAAQRLLAMWRKGDRSDNLRALSSDLLSRKEGLKAFERQLGAEAGWSNAFLLWSVTALDAPAVGMLTSTLRKNEAQLDCPSLSAGVFEMVRFGHGAGAQALWEHACNSRSHGVSSRGVGKFVFTHTDMNAVGPFDWRYPAGPGIQQDVVSGGEGLALQFSNAEPIRQPIAMRFAMLPSGAHQIRAFGGAVKPSMRRGPDLEITCFDRNGAANSMGKFDLTSSRMSFVSPADCISQRLTIEVGTGSGTIDLISIE